MNKTALELYLYMNSPEPIIEWLKSENVKTKRQAEDKLAPLVQSNAYSWASQVGAGNGGQVSLAGTSNCVNTVLSYFPEKTEELC